jgi:hypothetical protein
MNFARMFSDVKNSLFHPSKTARELAGRTTFVDGLLVFIIFAILTAIMSVCFNVASNLAFSMGGAQNLLVTF